ncbi:hypothetical protein ACJX0J_014128, partial [Zea mays]
GDGFLFIFIYTLCHAYNKINIGTWYIWLAYNKTKYAFFLNKKQRIVLNITPPPLAKMIA